MLEPNFFRTSLDYARDTVAYWWLLFPGLLMPLPDLTSTFTRRVKSYRYRDGFD